MDVATLVQRGRRKLSRTFRESPVGRALDNRTIRRFHEISYYRALWKTTTWMGHEVMQYPNDLMVKQEIIASVKPQLLIECGTAHGGGALFYAHMFDLIGSGRVLTIDIDPMGIVDEPDEIGTRIAGRPSHSRIEYYTGSSIAPETVAYVKAAVADVVGPVMVTLDSRHTCEHVARELELYHQFVTPGSYLIVEDGEINGHPVHTLYEPDKGPGPFEATEAFLAKHPNFEPDRNCERYLITGHPMGYLRRTLTD
jgi:cephalosporin hydroxylase